MREVQGCDATPVISQFNRALGVVFYDRTVVSRHRFAMIGGSYL